MSRKVGKDDLKFMHVVERWMIAAGPRVLDITSPWFGEPSYYLRSNVATPPPPGGVENVGTPTMGYSPGEALYIHPSRVVRLIGHEYPDMERAPDAWGDSVLQPIQDALKDAGLVTSSVATMISEAKIDIVKIPGLLNMMSTDKGTETLTRRFSHANVTKSVINALLLDSTEERTRKELSMANVDKILQMYMYVMS
jgi:phage-related protein (TIGR01555 family)